MNTLREQAQELASDLMGEHDHSRETCHQIAACLVKLANSNERLEQRLHDLELMHRGALKAIDELHERYSP